MVYKRERLGRAFGPGPRTLISAQASSWVPMRVRCSGRPCGREVQSRCCASSTSRRSTTASVATPPSACAPLSPTNNSAPSRSVVEITGSNNNNQHQQHQQQVSRKPGQVHSSRDACRISSKASVRVACADDRVRVVAVAEVDTLLAGPTLDPIAASPAWGYDRDGIAGVVAEHRLPDR
jgi:hypothetical protein